MRLRDNNNAVSATFATVAFILVGCAIAACGAAANIETGVLKFGLIAYLFMAGPLFLASFSGGWSRTKHTSFRATPPQYMAGKRVKPHLRRLAVTCTSISLAAMLGAFVCLIWAANRFQLFSGRDPWWSILFTGIPVLAYALTLVTFAFVAARLGWATRQEARELLTKGRRWPETWLEPLDSECKK